VDALFVVNTKMPAKIINVNTRHTCNVVISILILEH